MIEKRTWQLGEHGGARAGSGAKSADHVKSPHQSLYESSRARNELAKAGLNEMSLLIKQRVMLPRAKIRQKSATAIAALVQTLRSVGDRLENEGVPVEVCEAIERVISEELNELADALALMVCGADD